MCELLGLNMPQPLDLTEWEWETESEEFRKFVPSELRTFLPQVERQKRPLAQPEISRPFAHLLKEKFTHAKFEEEEEAQVTISSPSVDMCIMK